MEKMEIKTKVASAVSTGALLLPVLACAEPATVAVGNLIDWSGLASSMLVVVGGAIAAALTIGAAVTLARMAYKFFKSFGK